MGFNVYISYDHGTINLSVSMMDDKSLSGILKVDFMFWLSCRF